MNRLRAGGGGATPFGPVAAIDVSFDPSGTIEATNVQDAIEELDSETQAALADLAASFPGGTTGIGTYLVSGAAIAWESGLTYRVGAANYFINGVAVVSAEQTVTLNDAEPTDDRIDVLVLDAAGVLSAIAGTPAADPAEPSIDPAVYLRLGIVYVQAGSTEPEIVQTNIYADNAEWTTAVSAASINPDSTNNPRSGTKDIEGTNVAANAYVTLTKPAAGTTDLATQNTLVFYVRLKAAFPSTKAFRVAWYSGTSLRGTQVTVSNGLFGFSGATVGTYQQIVVPISAFNMPVGNLVTTLRITIIGSGANVGFYIDDIILNSGATVIPSLTAGRALISNVSGNVAASSLTAAALATVARPLTEIVLGAGAAGLASSPNFALDLTNQTWYLVWPSGALASPGEVSLNAPSGISPGPGGDFYISGGNAIGAGSDAAGGNVWLAPGTGRGAGDPGFVALGNYLTATGLGELLVNDDAFAGTGDSGAPGEVLTSQGPGLPPIWATVAVVGFITWLTVNVVDTVEALPGADLLGAHGAWLTVDYV